MPHPPFLDGNDTPKATQSLRRECNDTFQEETSSMVENSFILCSAAHRLPESCTEIGTTDLPPPTKFTKRSHADILSSTSDPVNREIIAHMRASVGRMIRASEPAKWSCRLRATVTIPKA